MYDFDRIIDRRHTDSLKWDVDDSVLPMWVADMDFPAAPEIVDALTKRLTNPVFGYSNPTEEWCLAYRSWWKQRHHLDMNPQDIHFCAGVVPAISSLIQALTTPGEAIAMLTPTYNHFYHCIRSHQRQALEIPLTLSNDTYSIDWTLLEQTLSSSHCPLMILCNPQNPTGTIWTSDDLQRIGELCHRCGTIVLSDEIHCDLSTPGKSYTPFSSASETCRNISITCLAPTKAFNIAGLQTSAIYVPNQRLQRIALSAFQKNEIAMPNSFATEAAIAAFTKGGPWLEELNQYIYQNKTIVRTYLQSEVPSVRIIGGDATYLIWLDCRSLRTDSKTLAGILRKQAGVFLMSGSEYGRGGEGFLRMNVACPKSLLMEGLDRFRKGIDFLQHTTQ